MLQIGLIIVATFAAGSLNLSAQSELSAKVESLESESLAIPFHARATSEGKFYVAGINPPTRNTASFLNVLQISANHKIESVYKESLDQGTLPMDPIMMTMRWQLDGVLAVNTILNQGEHWMIRLQNGQLISRQQIPTAPNASPVDALFLGGQNHTSVKSLSSRVSGYVLHDPETNLSHSLNSASIASFITSIVETPAGLYICSSTVNPYGAGSGTLTLSHLSHSQKKISEITWTGRYCEIKAMSFNELLVISDSTDYEKGKVDFHQNVTASILDSKLNIKSKILLSNVRGGMGRFRPIVINEDLFAVVGIAANRIKGYVVNKSGGQLLVSYKLTVPEEIASSQAVPVLSQGHISCFVSRIGENADRSVTRTLTLLQWRLP